MPLNAVVHDPYPSVGLARKKSNHQSVMSPAPFVLTKKEWEETGADACVKTLTPFETGKAVTRVITLKLTRFVSSSDDSVYVPAIFMDVVNEPLSDV